jgi:hypothetical protein
MDPLAVILISIAVLLSALHLMTRRSVARATRASRHRSFRFARLAVRTWLQHQRGQAPEEPDSLIEAAREIREECGRRHIAEPQVVSVLLMPEGLPRLEALGDLMPTEELNSVEIPPSLDPDRPSYEGVTDSPEPFDLPAALHRAATSQ